MHYLLLVTLSTWPDANSDAVRDQVHDALSRDDSFCGEGGRFGSPLCDWFVLGGRWSGHLSQARLGTPYREALQAACPRLGKDFYSTADLEHDREKLNEVWKSFGGYGDHPMLRDSYRHFGFADDAMLVDRMLYDALLAGYAGESRSDDRHFVDLDDDPVNESFIGSKWIAVVDYHN